MRYKMKNEYIDNKIKGLEQKINRTGQFHLDAVNEKFAELDKKISDFVKHTTTTKYNNDYKKLWEENTKDYNDLSQHRLNDYTKGVKNSKDIETIFEMLDKLAEYPNRRSELEQDINRKIFARMDSTDSRIEKKVDNMLMLEQDIDRKIFAKMDSIEQNIPDINQPTDQTEALKDYCDRLESNYYKLRSELDAVYKVLEMDALDIQDLYDKLENHPKKSNHAVFVDAVSFDNGEELNNAK